MHRIPLDLVTPAILWDRLLPEYVLFERTLTEFNVSQTLEFLDIMDRKAFEFNKKCNFIEDLARAKALLRSGAHNNIMEAFCTLRKIVWRCPKQSACLPEALFIRGHQYLHMCLFEAASCDFEMFLFVTNFHSSYEELCYVNAGLVICYYMNKRYEKMRQHYSAYSNYKAYLSDDESQRSELGMYGTASKFPISTNQNFPQLDKLEKHINMLMIELNMLEEEPEPEYTDEVYFSIPYCGFNTGHDIPLSSANCQYFDRYNRRAGVYAKEDIPSNNVILIEHPLLQSFNTPFLQCEICLRTNQEMYTCLDCRYKTYCSLTCLEKDKETHMIECFGFKSLALPILDAANLYRVFIRVSSILHERVFTNSLFRIINSAAEALELIEEVIDSRNYYGFQYLRLLKEKPNYYKLLDMQYPTLVTTAFRLAILIDNKTFAIESFYQRLPISNKQKLIVVGSILMRVQCHLLLNTYDFEYKRDLMEEHKMFNTMQKQMIDVETVPKPQRYGIIEDLNSFFKVDIQNDILDRCQQILDGPISYTPVQSSLSSLTQPCNRIQPMISTYKDSIAELYFSPDGVDFFLFGETAGMPTTQTSASMMCARLMEMTAEEQCLFVKIFISNFHMHMGEYFVHMLVRYTGIDQIMSVYCPTLSKFSHSCDPNVDVVILGNGIVLGKTIRDVEKGEEITISYKANYMRHTRTERQKFLRALGIKCICNYCRMPEDEEPISKRLTIYCDSCPNMQITPRQGKCSKCRSNYNSLMFKYRNQIKIIEDELNKFIAKNLSDDREMYIMHMLHLMKASQYFSAYNVFRVKAQLKLAKFLSLNNFGEACWMLIQESRRQLLQTYSERTMWFTFYADMLALIKTLLYYNIDKNLYSVSPSELHELCKFGLYIVNGQKEYLKLNERFDIESDQILKDYNTLLEWDCAVSYSRTQSVGEQADRIHTPRLEFALEPSLELPKL